MQTVANHCSLCQNKLAAEHIIKGLRCCGVSGTFDIPTSYWQILNRRCKPLLVFATQYVCDFRTYEMQNNHLDLSTYDVRRNEAISNIGTLYIT